MDPKDSAPTPTSEDTKPVADQPKDSKESQISSGIAPVLPPEKENAKQGQPDSKQEPDGDQSFTKIDPQTLPDHLKPIYNNMLTDYKEKMQAISSQRKEITAEQRQQAIEETLNGLTQDQFMKLTSHPGFTNNLMTYLNSQGQQIPANGQQAQPEPQQPDLSMMTDMERQLYDENQQLKADVKEIKSQVKDIDIGNRNATIAAQDAKLNVQYEGVYSADAVNQFINDVSTGRRQLTREDVHMIIDYKQGLNRAFKWGQKESYADTEDQKAASTLAGIQGQGTQSDEIPRPEKGENRFDFMARLFSNAKQKHAHGQSSKYLVDSDHLVNRGQGS